jgi:glycerol transport system ATP-binding protein
MTRGKVVQLGTPEALFERPAHTFVGHFIGSPGMNFVPAEVSAGMVKVGGQALAPVQAGPSLQGEIKLGIRPEYLGLTVRDAVGTLSATVRQVQDIGTYQLVTCDAAGTVLKARLAPDAQAPAVGSHVGLQVLNPHTCYYQNEELMA